MMTKGKERGRKKKKMMEKVIIRDQYIALHQTIIIEQVNQMCNHGNDIELFHYYHPFSLLQCSYLHHIALLKMRDNGSTLWLCSAAISTGRILVLSMKASVFLT